MKEDFEFVKNGVLKGWPKFKATDREFSYEQLLELATLLEENPNSQRLTSVDIDQYVIPHADRSLSEFIFSIFRRSLNILEIHPSFAEPSIECANNKQVADQYLRVLMSRFGKPESFTKGEIKQIRDMLPAIRYVYLENNAAVLGYDRLQLQTAMPPEFAKALSKTIPTAKKFGYDLIEFLPEESRQLVLAENPEAKPSEEKAIDIEPGKLEVAMDEMKPKTTPHEIRAQLLARRGVRLGFVETLNGAER